MRLNMIYSGKSYYLLTTIHVEPTSTLLIMLNLVMLARKRASSDMSCAVLSCMGL
jgi:hypothetical protein